MSGLPPPHRSRLLYVVTHAMMARHLLAGQLAWMQARGFEVAIAASPGADLDVVAAREGVTVLPVALPRAIAPAADLRSEGQHAHTCPAGVHRDERSLTQFSFELTESPQYGGAEGLGQHVLGADLKHARAEGSGRRQQSREVEVVGEDDKPFGVCPRHDLTIRCVRCSDSRPVERFMPLSLEHHDPARGEVHVYDDPHVEDKASSTSSDRHAA